MIERSVPARLTRRGRDAVIGSMVPAYDTPDSMKLGAPISCGLEDNTPETSPSGFVDGMAAAIAVGHCWQGVAASFQTFDALPEEQLVQIGVRSVDAGERARLDRSRVHRLDDALTNLSTTIDRLSDRVRYLYVHIDLDVIDAAELRANSYSASGGLRASQVAETIRTLASKLPFTAAAITALDPTLDPEKAWNVGEQLAQAVAECRAVPMRTP